MHPSEEMADIRIQAIGNRIVNRQRVEKGGYF